MPHPFFDAKDFPFNRPEAKKLLEVLVNTYSKVQEIEAVVQDLIGNRQWVLVNSGQPPYFVWRASLPVLHRNQAIRPLCDLLLGLDGIHASYVEDVKAVLNATFITQAKTVISDRLFLLDRIHVHAKLALLADEQALEKVLLIRGGKSSGKSHCRYLMQRRAEEAGADFIYIPAGKVTNARETIDQLYSHFNKMNEVPPMDESLTAWYKKVCLRLKEIAATQPDEIRKPLWIAMDDLGFDEQLRPILPDDVRLFFNQFALNMDTKGYSQWFRLMLINYPDEIPAEWPDSFWTDIDQPIAEDDIQASDVVECLQAWATSQNRAINSTDLAAVSTNLIQLVDTPQTMHGQLTRPRLRRIHDELARIVKELKGQAV